jgi:drug/metabolite transporter (DMT)-like permease
MFLYALREVSSAQAVSYTYLQPPMTALMAMLALGEQPTPMTLACGVVILLGIWLVNRPRSVRKRVLPVEPPETVSLVRPVER